MNEEIERGQRDAIEHLRKGEAGAVVRIGQEEVSKLCTLLGAFLEVNEGDFIVLGRRQRKRTVIANMEDVEYVFGYLKGLT